MQHHHLALGIAEDENVAVAEVGFLDGFFESHGAHGDRIVGANQMHFGGLGDGGKFVNDHVDRALASDRPTAARNASCGASAIPFLVARSLVIVAFLGAPAGLVLDRLLLQMIEGLADGEVMSPAWASPTSGPLRGLIVISALWRCFSTARITLVSNLSPEFCGFW